MKKTKSIILIALLGMPVCFADGLGLPTESQLEEDGVQTVYPEDNLPEDWDTREPEAGKIRMLAEILLNDAKQEIENQQADVPDGEQGKDNALYVKISLWLQNTEQVLINKTRQDLLAMTSLNADILKLSKSEENVHVSVLDLVGYVQSTNIALIYNLADFFKENQVLTEDQLDKMLSAFLCVQGFTEENEWEDESMPIDSAGVFIVDSVNSTTKLKTKNLEELQAFLGGTIDNSFFERYEAAGDGMDVLKTKYAANKVAIQAKFAEIVTYADQLEAQQESPNQISLVV